MDGSAKGGGALAACHVSKAPVYFIGVGEKIDDLEAFDATRYLSRVMGYGDLQALLEKAKEVAEEEELSPEELLKGEFTLQAFCEQLKAARKMGPLGKVMDMMGLKAQLPKEMLELGEEKLEGFKIIMDSMTKAEKQNPDIINSNRIARIAKGAGKTQEQVRELLKQFKQMKKAFKKLKDLDETKLEKGFDMGKLAQMFGKKKKLKIR
jgi:signal recognition particle subunit SRP54